MSIYPKIVNDSSYGRLYRLSSDIDHIGPSASTIPNYSLPTQPFLLKWKIERSNGNWYNFLNLQSFESRLGAGVHDIAEKYLLGETVDLTSEDISDYINTKDIILPYDAVKQLRNGVLSVCSWCDENQPDVVVTEKLLYSTEEGENGLKYPFCGRVDLVASIDGELWLLDIKTSKQVKDVMSYQCQLSIYKMLWDAMHPSEPIDRIGVIHANKTFRGSKPPMGTQKTVEYTFDEDLVWDCVKMFNRCYQGFDITGYKKKESSPLLLSRRNENG